ncbi:MAG: DUF748 domain-containing protein [Gammaproteobacteria bacterium]|nr:DUF748 domain-containing protein [Gammaproteobacteria bacterium]
MNRAIKYFIVWPIVLLIVLLVILRLTLSPITKSAIGSWFGQQGIESSIEDISFEISDGLLSLTGLVGTADGKQVLALERANISWSWSSLFDSQLRLKSIAIDGLAFDVERGPDARMVVAGIDLDKLGSEQDPAPTPTDEEPVEWSILLQQLEINNFNTCYFAMPQYDYCNGFETLSWKGDVSLDLATLAEPSLALKVDGDFKLSKLKIHNNRLERVLLGFDEFSMRQVHVDSLDNISIDSISLLTLAIMERGESSEQAQITHLEKLQIDQLKLEQMSHLEIAEVNLLNHQASLVNQADKQLEINEWLEAGQDRAADSSEIVATEFTSEFTFAIEKVNYQTKKSLEYQDLSLAKPFVVKLDEIELVLENLDSRQPEAESRMRYAARVAERGSIKLEGSITPLDSTASFDLDGKIEGIDLRDLSPFTADAIGHKVKSGQLDAVLNLKADDNILASEVDLTLHQFNLTALSTADQEKIDSSFGFPLNASLSLLKDRNNKIALTIPITGDLQNPDFDPNDAITQATSTAITTAVLNYYTPFGLVTLVDGLFSLATALSFEPVIFADGRSDIGQVDASGLDKISSLMQDRPGVDVTLCGFTNSADRKLLLPETVEITADELELDSDQLAQLAKLGETRAAATKDFLVSKQIDPTRLVLCASEHAEGESQARVEISI